jgi:FkbM family methyltransferase
MIETIYWHTLHPKHLGTNATVLDLGANCGHFAQAITRRFDCNCVAVEPSPIPFDAIPVTSRISKIQAAVADKSGTMLFHVASESVASSLVRRASSHLESIEVRVFSLADLLAHGGWSRIDLLKIDIEGAEIGMLAACPDEILACIAQISVEFHDFCDITPEVDVKETLARLHGLGFYSVRMSRIGHQDTWLINRRLVNISTSELLFTRYCIRNWKGMKRVAKRRLDRLVGKDAF